MKKLLGQNYIIVQSDTSGHIVTGYSHLASAKDIIQERLRAFAQSGYEIERIADDEYVLRKSDNVIYLTGYDVANYPRPKK